MSDVADAERSGQPFLLFRDRDDRQRVFLFASGCTSASVGRGQSSDLVLDWDDQVSRLHARFERGEDGWVLVDDGSSSNGTFVNDERVRGRRRLNRGDAIRFGRTTVTFRSPPPQQPDRPATADPATAPPPVSVSTTQRRVLVALCHPYKGGTGFAIPATDEQIAEDLFLAVGEVRAHLRVLSAKLGVEEPTNAETRVRLVERAFSTGVISERDL